MLAVREEANARQGDVYDGLRLRVYWISGCRMELKTRQSKDGS
ncbi:MAG: hypothetical protein RM338_14555 [Nostoc sp. DedQUE12a]|nr:hypothetical protein [Nostoc sp. DedQUE12a]